MRRTAWMLGFALLAAACTTGGGGSDGPPPAVVVEGEYSGTVRVDANTCEPNPALAGVGKTFPASVAFRIVGDQLEIEIDAPALGIPAVTLRTRSYLFDPATNRLLFGFSNLPFTASTGCRESVDLAAELVFDPAADAFAGTIEGDGTPAASGCAGVPNPCVLDLSPQGTRP